MAVLLLGWVVGMVLMLLPAARSAASLRRLARRSRIIRDGKLAETLREVAHELGLRRCVSIYVGLPDAMPMVWGIWRAKLLLPSSAQEWPAARLRAVLLHELAHVRRWDPLTLMMAHFARAVHWFNPLAWWAVHRLRIEQEHACDDFVLRAGVNASDYANDVLEIATVLRVAPTAGSAALSMANPARIESRLRSIVEVACNRAALSGWLFALALSATFAVALPLTMLCAVDENPHATKSAEANPNPANPALPAPPDNFGQILKRETGKAETQSRPPRRQFEPIKTVVLPSAPGSKRFFSLEDGQLHSAAPTGFIEREVLFIYRLDGDVLTRRQVADPEGGQFEKNGRGQTVFRREPAANDAVTGREEAESNVAANASAPGLSATRGVVDEWLAHVGAGRTAEMWKLTTRESGVAPSASLAETWQFKSIRARHVLGTATAAMVISSRYSDNAGRARVLQFLLVNQNGKWLIRQSGESSPGDAQRRVEGFAAYPGVRFDVRPDDILGDWETFNWKDPTPYSLKADGTGETRSAGGPNPGKVVPLNWELKGDVFRLNYGDTWRREESSGSRTRPFS